MKRKFSLIGVTVYLCLSVLQVSTLAAQPASNEIVELIADKTFKNPIISGFYPDPSICRVGDDYYTVHSTFEYFPGVPVFHSKDLVNWRQLGYCLTRKSQLSLEKTRSSGGIYAPTLRYHNGRFYMITTNVSGGGNFYVTATNPAGPWSEPIWLDKEGIDPSLFFDDDGKVYYTRHVGGGDGYIGLCEIDIEQGKLKGPLKKIWAGTGGVWAEGPHLYKVNGIYYLLISEGGTSYGHMLTVARSNSPMGPFVSNSANPILTHRNHSDHPFRAIGHADLVNTPDGWWLVCLGIRPQGGHYHHLGRETFLAPVEWNQDGWPVVNGGGTIEPVMSAPKLKTHVFEKKNTDNNFNGKTLRMEWNYLRNPYYKNYSLEERKGYLRLKGTSLTMNDQDSPTFVGQRQTLLDCDVAAKLDFNPAGSNEEAGLVIRGNENNHYEIGVTNKNSERKVFLRKVLKGETVNDVIYKDIPAGEIVLTVSAEPLNYTFACLTSQGEEILLGSALTKDVSSESIGGFTGVYIGLYATGNGIECTAHADFDWFKIDD